MASVWIDGCEWLSRTGIVVGEEGLKRLAGANVLVVGLGGVGAYAAELVARSGVGRMTVIDGDTVALSNINRQLPATSSSVGLLKAEVMAARLRDINPDIVLNVVPRYVEAAEMPGIVADGGYDMVIDAIDTVAPKVALIAACKELGVEVVSSMGAGGRIDPSAVRFADISKTEQCALARVVRRGLRERGIRSGVMTVFSVEPVPVRFVLPVDERNKRSTVGTLSFMPALFGCYLAAYAVRKIAGLW